MHSGILAEVKRCEVKAESFNSPDQPAERPAASE